jgi:hypothetical protein
MLIDLLAIGSSGFNPQNSFLNPLNQHELSIFWGVWFAPVYPGQFAPELGGQFQPGKVVSLLRNMWSVYSVFSTSCKLRLFHTGPSPCYGRRTEETMEGLSKSQKGKGGK